MNTIKMSEKMTTRHPFRKKAKYTVVLFQILSQKSKFVNTCTRRGDTSFFTVTCYFKISFLGRFSRMCRTVSIVFICATRLCRNVSHRSPNFNQISVRVIKSDCLLPLTVCHQKIDIFGFGIKHFKSCHKFFYIGLFKI